jgi:AbrB family looped-hinge helix DNA binding protein
MTTIKVSPKFQIVIPKEVREATKIKSGMQIVMVPYGNRIELIPLKTMASLKGTLKGMDASNTREKKDRI